MSGPPCQGRIVRPRVAPYDDGSQPTREVATGDVRSVEDMAPVIEHNGTTPVWWLVPPQELRQATEGGFLELVSEWEVAGGGAVDAHSHPTHEFYYILSGRGIMKIATRSARCRPGTWCTRHRTPLTASGRSARTPPYGAGAIGTPGAGPVDYS